MGVKKEGNARGRVHQQHKQAPPFRGVPGSARCGGAQTWRNIAPPPPPLPFASASKSPRRPLPAPAPARPREPGAGRGGARLGGLRSVRLLERGGQDRRRLLGHGLDVLLRDGGVPLGWFEGGGQARFWVFGVSWIDVLPSKYAGRSNKRRRGRPETRAGATAWPRAPPHLESMLRKSSPLMVSFSIRTFGGGLGQLRWHVGSWKGLCCVWVGRKRGLVLLAPAPKPLARAGPRPPPPVRPPTSTMRSMASRLSPICLRATSYAF